VVDERSTGGSDEQLLVKTTAARARHSPALSESDFLAADRGDVPARFTQGQYWSCRPETIGLRNRAVPNSPGLILIYSS